jgi:hypothetical protein
MTLRRTPFMRSFALEREVERLLREERFELAVLVSQTLLELRTEAELANYVDVVGERTLGEAALDLLHNYNLANGRTQKFFEQLVGVRFKDHCPQELAAVRAHVERRNGIAHRGEEVTREEAQGSFIAVKTITAIAHELAYRRLGLDDDLEEERRQEREWEGLEDDD